MKKGKVGIPAGPVCVLESSVPGFLESDHGIRFTLKSAEDASCIIEHCCLAGAQRNREVEFADGIIKTVDCCVITGKKNTRPRIFRHMLEMGLESSDPSLACVAKSFLLPHQFKGIHDRNVAVIVLATGL